MEREADPARPPASARGSSPGPYRRSRVVRRVLPLARAVLRRRARGPRLGDYDPRCMLELEEHPVAAARHRAIDVHTHLGRWLTPDGSWMEPDVGRLLELMEACNVATMVNLDGRWDRELDDNLERYDRAHPGRFVTFCQLDWGRLEAPHGADALVESLERSAGAGARGLKVWKDLGLSVSVRGRRILPDDPVLAPVWEAAGKLGLPVLVHVADPAAFFRPVDRHNERLEELLRHPSISLAREGVAAFDRLIDALEAVVAGNPRTTFIGAHAGCYAENLARVSTMLDRYPNYRIDLAGRAAELGRQPRAAARLIERHADRVLFGTDVFPLREADYRLYFRLLESDDEHFAYSSTGPGPHGRWAISGLNLSDHVLEQVYATNAARVLSAASARDLR